MYNFFCLKNVLTVNNKRIIIILAKIKKIKERIIYYGKSITKKIKLTNDGKIKSTELVEIINLFTEEEFDRAKAWIKIWNTLKNS